jgi:hypothetical protein
MMHVVYNNKICSHLQILKEFLGSISLPRGLEKRVHDSSFASEQQISDAASIADELIAYKETLRFV